MKTSAREQEFHYTHGVAPGLRPGDVLIAWMSALPLVVALTAVV